MRQRLAQGIPYVMGRSGSGLHSTYDATYQSIVMLPETVRQMDESLQYRGYHTLRWALLFVSISGLSMYGFRHEIKENIGSTGAELTTRTLSDESVQREARIFLTEVLQYEETRNMLGQLMYDVLRRESTRDAALELFSAILADPTFQERTSVFFSDVMATDTFRNTSAEVAQYSAHEVLNDTEINRHALEWARTVLEEPDLHSQAGDAIWGALRSTFVPGFLGGRRKQLKDKEEKEREEKGKEDKLVSEATAETGKGGSMSVKAPKEVEKAMPDINAPPVPVVPNKESLEPSELPEMEVETRTTEPKEKPSVRVEEKLALEPSPVESEKPDHDANDTQESSVVVESITTQIKQLDDTKGQPSDKTTQPAKEAMPVSEEVTEKSQDKSADKDVEPPKPKEATSTSTSPKESEEAPTRVRLSKTRIDIPLNDPADKLKATKPT